MANQSRNLSDIRHLVSFHLTSLPTPVFLATTQIGGKVLTLFGFESPPSQNLRDLESQLRKSGLDVDVRFKTHSSAALSGIRSIEGIADIARRNVIVYDPSQIFTRSRAISDLIDGLRRLSPRQIKDVHVDTWRRTIYCRFQAGITSAGIEEFRPQAEALLQAWMRRVPRSMRMSVQLCHALPSGCKLATGDASSLRPLSLEGLKLKLRRRISAGVLATAVAAYSGAAYADTTAPAQRNVTVIEKASAPPSAQVEPAVNAPNFTMGTATSVLDGDVWSGGGAKVSLPVGTLLGVQLEAGIGQDDYYGLGGHVFWRNPESGLLGAFGSYESFDGADMVRVGLEGEVYIDAVTLGGRLGHQSGDVENGWLAQAEVGLYATPDLVLRIRGEYNPEESGASAGVEWRPAFTQVPGLSVFADTQFDEDGFDRVMVGMKLHFGVKGASLIDRDRRADPTDILFNLRTLDEARGY